MSPSRSRESKMLTTKQVATQIGMSEWWVRQKRKRGATGGPPYYRIGRKILYSAEEVSAWLTERRRG